MSRRRFRTRDLLNRLRELGCVPQRISGSHQILVAPGNRTLCIPVNHPGRDVSPTVLSSVRRVLRNVGLEL